MHSTRIVAKCDHPIVDCGAALIWEFTDLMCDIKLYLIPLN